MTITFCTQCWSEAPKGAAVCPHCGDDIVARANRPDYTQKLIAALEHAEPTVAVRAAWILGERRESKAVVGLCRLVRESTDVLVVESALESLAKIGDRRAAMTVRWAVNHVNPLIRSAAARAVALEVYRKAPHAHEV